MHHPADLELARAVLRGERAAFERFYETFYAPVRAFAERHGAAGPEARALTALVLERALEALEGYEGRAPLAALVLAVARREVPAAPPAPPAPQRQRRPLRSRLHELVADASRAR